MNYNTMQTLENKPKSGYSDNFLRFENVSKVYPTAKGPYTVLTDVNFNVEAGEFICVIGHSGCGKSTLLNMVSGFSQPSSGSVTLKGREITQPGPDRMVVFQNYALLPWLTVFDNVYLAVDQVFPQKSEAEKRSIVKDHLAMVGLTEASLKKPKQSRERTKKKTLKKQYLFFLLVYYWGK
jgi:bicarbonate transport system ATP-binding protein